MPTQLLISWTLTMDLFGKRSFLLLSCFALLLLLAGCGQSSFVGLDEQITIKWNRFIDIESESLRISFLDIVSDNRCPEDVECKTGGEAVILVRVMKDGVRLIDEEITISAENPAPSLTVENYTIDILELSPDDQPRNEGSYELTIQVSKR